MYNAYTIKQLTEVDSFKPTGSNEWIPGRPIRYPSVWNDIKLAWLVLTRRADVVVWPQDEGRIFDTETVVTRIPLDEDHKE